MSEVCVIKYGGSFLIPHNEYDPEAILFLIDLVKEFPKKRFVFVVGGGGLARSLNEVSKTVLESIIPEGHRSAALDEIGIAATRMNARVVLETMTEILGDHVVDQRVCIDPENPLQIKKQVTIAAGGYPGHSTDYDMLVIAKNVAASRVFKISDFDQVLNVAPDQYVAGETYEPIRQLSWSELRNLIGVQYVPGGHYPLDPRAVVYGAAHAKKQEFTLYIGKKEQLPHMIAKRDFFGTVVVNDDASFS